MSSEKCPGCGYPSTFEGKHYKGIYTPGRRCDNCGYLEKGPPDDFCACSYSDLRHERCI